MFRALRGGVRSRSKFGAVFGSTPRGQIGSTGTSAGEQPAGSTRKRKFARTAEAGANKCSTELGSSKETQSPFLGELDIGDEGLPGLCDNGVQKISTEGHGHCMLNAVLGDFDPEDGK